jgi:mono/diheme cytochrome c family protein
MNSEPNMPSTREEIEPTSGTAPAPVWLFVLIVVLAFWGMGFLDNRGGGFQPVVYAPYESVKELEEDQPKSKEGEVFAKGKVIYETYCMVCHQSNGGGNPATFVPPLAGSEWVLAKEPGRIIRIVSKGLSGPIEVTGKQFGAGQMLAMGDLMQGDEPQKAESIAAVLTYVRGNSAWGNNASPVTVEQVTAVRKKIADRNAAWVVDELLKIPENE